MDKNFNIHRCRPLIDFTKIIAQYRPKPKYWLQAALYYLKFLLFEPLRIIEDLVWGPRIRRHRPAAPPVFILGYYRSGTTYLQEILMADPQFGYLNFYQCFFSKGFLISERLLKKPFQLVLSFFRFKHPAHGIPFHFDMPGEEDVSLVSSGFEHAPNWGQVFPSQFKKLFDKTVFFETCSDAERESFRGELRTLVQRVSLACQGKRLLLKSPPHTGRLKFLKETFPGARFIFIRRSPYLTFKSNQKLWQSFRATCLEDFSEAEADENILWSMQKCYDALESQRAELTENEFIEVPYESLMDDPLEILSEIYHRLGIEGFEAARPLFTEFAKQNHGKNVARHRYQKSDCLKVEGHLKEWITRWNYERPPLK